MTTQHELIASDLLSAESPDPARDLAADRRSAGALRRHARRQRRQWRSRQRHAGGDAVPRRDLSRHRQGRRAPRSRRASSIRAPISPRSEPGEILTAIRIPVPAAGHGYAYEKLKRKIGDYATAAAAVVLTLKGGGKVATCSIGLTNVAETPLWAEEAANILVGSTTRRRDREARRSRPPRRSPRPPSDAPRPGALPHQDGRRDARARARPRQSARRG